MNCSDSTQSVPCVQRRFVRVFPFPFVFFFRVDSCDSWVSYESRTTKYTKHTNVSVTYKHPKHTNETPTTVVFDSCLRWFQRQRRITEIHRRHGIRGKEFAVGN